MSKIFLKTIMFTKREITSQEYQEILAETLAENNVDNIQDLQDENILINKLVKNSTINGIAGIDNVARQRITETFKEFRRAGTQAIICTSDSLGSTKYFASQIGLIPKKGASFDEKYFNKTFDFNHKILGDEPATDPDAILKREKLKANVIRFIRNFKRISYDNKHGMYSGQEIVMKFE